MTAPAQTRRDADDAAISHAASHAVSHATSHRPRPLLTDMLTDMLTLGRFVPPDAYMTDAYMTGALPAGARTTISAPPPLGTDTAILADSLATLAKELHWRSLMADREPVYAHDLAGLCARIAASADALTRLHDSLVIDVTDALDDSFPSHSTLP